MTLFSMSRRASDASRSLACRTCQTHHHKRRTQQDFSKFRHQEGASVISSRVRHHARGYIPRAIICFSIRRSNVFRHLVSRACALDVFTFTYHLTITAMVILTVIAVTIPQLSYTPRHRVPNLIRILTSLAANSNNSERRSDLDGRYSDRSDYSTAALHSPASFCVSFHVLASFASDRREVILTIVDLIARTIHSCQPHPFTLRGFYAPPQVHKQSLKLPNAAVPTTSHIPTERTTFTSLAEAAAAAVVAAVAPSAEAPLALALPASATLLPEVEAIAAGTSSKLSPSRATLTSTRPAHLFVRT